MKPIDTALTDTEKEAWAALVGAVHDETAALVRVELNGVAKAALADIRSVGDGEVGVYPLALLIDPATFEQLTPPGDPEVMGRGGEDDG